MATGRDCHDRKNMLEGCHFCSVCCPMSSMTSPFRPICRPPAARPSRDGEFGVDSNNLFLTARGPQTLRFPKKSRAYTVLQPTLGITDFMATSSAGRTILPLQPGFVFSRGYTPLYLPPRTVHTSLCSWPNPRYLPTWQVSSRMIHNELVARES